MERQPRGADAEFTYFTQEQAATVRSLVRQAFAERGVEVATGPSVVTAMDGRTFGLANVMATCRGATFGQATWPGLVREHVQAVLGASVTADPLTLHSRRTILSHIHLRVAGASMYAPAIRNALCVRPLCGELVESLVLHIPPAVMTLPKQSVEQFGEDELRRAALENLLKEPLGDVTVVPLDHGAELYQLSGDSGYEASRVLVLPDLLRRLMGERAHPNGVLVGAPHRHQLAVLPLDHQGSVAGVYPLAKVTAELFAEAPGAVSPYVYWWRDGIWKEVTGRGPDGKLVIDPDGSLAQLVPQLPPPPA